MTGITDLNQLLACMNPELKEGEYVFCAVQRPLSAYLHLDPLATFQENEGLTLVLEKSLAEKNNLPFEGVFKLISLSVHSSLHAVGLTAAVASKLAESNISANVMAAYHHDHIFIPEVDANKALKLLKGLSS